MGDDPDDETPDPGEDLPHDSVPPPHPPRRDWTKDPGPARQAPDWTTDAGPAVRAPDENPWTPDPGSDAQPSKDGG